jgi:hypothetical protein
MTKEQPQNAPKYAGAPSSDSDEARERSTIQFPYNDLNDAVTIAKVIHENAGDQCAIDQLAAYVKQSLTSGSFRVRLSTAATFGITENERGSVRLTDLGRQVADPLQETAARIEAFMRVPLYAQLYDHYKGYTLPPPSAVEKYMKEIGVSSKQTGRARQAFMRSARQAGFFAHGEDRLVRPAGPGTKPIEPQKSEASGAELEEGSGKGGGGMPPDIDPIIRGLLVRLPKSGDVWPEADRKLWLELLEGSFRLIYKDRLQETSEHITPGGRQRPRLSDEARALGTNDEGAN